METPSDSSIEGLVARLAQPHRRQVRCRAAERLGELGEAATPAIPVLFPLLADRDGEVREAAATALRQIGPEAVPALIALVEARDAQRMKAWAESRAKITQWCTLPREDVIVIESRKSLGNLWWTAYDILDEHARLEAAQEAAPGVLGKLGATASIAVPTIRQALADPNPRIQLAAVRALGGLGPEARSAMPDLVPMLLHCHASVREAAAEALARIDGN